ncbi:MAG: hypothetical protein AAGF19_01485 [Pseudomonadota bacterium]
MPATTYNQDLENAVTAVMENFPQGDDFVSESFLGRLHGDNAWDLEAYSRLDGALTFLTDHFAGADVPREVAWPVVRIFSHAMTLIAAHFNAADTYRIKADSDTLFDLRCRFQSVIEGLFEGRARAA